MSNFISERIIQDTLYVLPTCTIFSEVAVVKKIVTHMEADQPSSASYYIISNRDEWLRNLDNQLSELDLESKDAILGSSKTIYEKQQRHRHRSMSGRRASTGSQQT